MGTGVEGEVETEEGEEGTGGVETTNGEGGETAATEEAVEGVTDREAASEAVEADHREEEEVVVAGILVLLMVEEEAVELRKVATTKLIQASSKMYWISKEWMK
jgi:hypothetical protein